MPSQKIDIENFLELRSQYPVFDVRSPGEFNHAHIPGAFSLPLFSNDERKIVGTIYKQEGREVAIKKGLEFFGPRMKSVIEEVESTISITNHRSSSTNNKTVLLHCWRGGMRSAAIAWLLDLYGFRVYTLTGGYKVFRNYVLDSFNRSYDFKILGGYTGSGKTGLLSALKERGEIIIDLEALASHKGSAFGNIGMPLQPSQEMFENLLALELISCEKIASLTQKQIWLEDESQRIGLVNIPNLLWKTMRSSPVYFLDIPFEIRLKHITKEYGGLPKNKLIGSVQRISQKLGGLQAKNAVSYLEEGQIEEAFRILLTYYDRFYFKALHNREAINSLLHTINCESITSENVNQLAISFKPEKT